FITSDGMVEMIVSPEISALTSQTIRISTGVNVPVISKRSADTVVVTPNGQTVMIGGMMQNDKETEDSKIPHLGDIPGIGALFRRKTKSNRKTELMIFLTPHIVSDQNQLVAMAARVRQNTTLVSKALTEQELDSFLEIMPVDCYNF